MAQAKRFLSDPTDIEDVVQETYLRLIRALPEFESEAQLLAYARRVVANLCIDRYRSDDRRPAVVTLSADLTDELTAEDSLSDPVIREEDAAMVRSAISHLLPEHRAALIKREFEEKPLTVIADELAMPVESVKHLLFRARRSLRRHLAGTMAEPGVEPVDLSVNSG